MSKRLAYFLGFLFVLMILAVSIYLQVFDGFVPCALCTLQRLTLVLLGILFLIGVFTHRYFSARIIVNSLAILTTWLGLFLAGRQIWLQKFPAAVGNECGVSLQYMLQILPLNEVAQKVFEGSTECAQRGWEFLHLNMAEWSFVAFLILSLYCVYLFLNELHWHGNHGNHV